MARITLLLDFASQYKESERDRDSTSASSQPRYLAPPDSRVHMDFCRAAKEGQHRERLAALYAQGADADARDGHRLTALFYAAARGDEDNVQLLLKMGVDVNPYHVSYGTPICVAALRGHGRVVEALLRHKANLSYSGDLGPPMHCACYGGDKLTVSVILDHDGDLEKRSTVPMEMLSWIACAKNDEVLCYNNLRLDVKQARRVRCTPILLAADRSHFELLRVLSRGMSDDCFSDHCWEFIVERDTGRSRRDQDTQPSFSSHGSHPSRSGPSYTSKTSTSSDWSFLGFPQPAPAELTSTLLMWAAKSLRVDLIRYLLGTGSIADLRDKLGRTALHYAASPFEDAVFTDAKKCIQRLLKAGADRNGTDLKGKTPLMIAASSDHPTLDPRISRRWSPDLHARFVSSFLSEDTSVNDKDGLGWTALMYAVSTSHCQPNTIELLCRHGAATAELEASGCTALHIAIESNAPKNVISVLLNNGADPNAMMPRDGSQIRHLRPLDLAVSRLYDIEGVVEVLLSHGADPYLLNDRAGTSRSIAGRFSRQDIFDMFTANIKTECPPGPSPAVTGSTSSTRSWYKRLPLFASNDKRI